MAGAQWKKAAALSISVLCAAVNLAIALQFVSLWHASWRDTITESESIAGGWAKGVEALEGLAALYSLAATAANIVGLVGIVRRNARCVRFWRDFSIADFACSVTTIVLAVYAASRYYGLRSGVCEELSRHDEMVMELAEMGITLENCEQWSQHVLFAFVCSVIFLLLVRLHLIITVSKVFARRPHHSRRSSSMQHIYLLPNLPGKASPRVQAATEEGAAYMPAVVYAPIPLSSLSDADVRQISAREAWVSPTSVDMQPARTSLSGRINLPIAPGEGLFPGSREKQ